LARNGLKVFNVSSSDEVGGRWNGHDIIEPLKGLGIDAKIGSFWSKTSKSEKSIELFPGRKTRLLAEATMALESLTGRQSTSLRFRFIGIEPTKSDQERSSFSRKPP